MTDRPTDIVTKAKAFVEGLSPEALRDVLGKMQEIHDGAGESLGQPGWVYRSIPWCTRDAMNMLIDIIGEGNMQWLAMTTRNEDDVRGQVLISPDGLANLTRHATAAKVPA